MISTFDRPTANTNENATVITNPGVEMVSKWKKDYWKDLYFKCKAEKKHYQDLLLEKQGKLEKAEATATAEHDFRIHKVAWERGQKELTQKLAEEGAIRKKPRWETNAWWQGSWWASSSSSSTSWDGA